MVPRSAPKTIFVASRVEDPQKVSAPDVFFEAFGAVWVILDASCNPSGCQGGPKIEQLGNKTRQNIEKLGAERGVSNNMIM